MQKNIWKTHISLIDNFPSGWINYITKCTSIDAAFVKCHYVLCERARFVREYILYLAELLIQRCRTGFGWGFRFCMIHLLIPIN